jgi:hypothetical protein
MQCALKKWRGESLKSFFAVNGLATAAHRQRAGGLEDEDGKNCSQQSVRDT